MTLRQYLLNNLLYGENSREANRARHPTLTTGLVMPDPSRVWGCDFSHWNIPPVNMQRMKDQYGMKFVIIKGCDGSVNTKYYDEHKAAAKTAGLPFGMYVWLYRAVNVSIDSQVNAWLTRFNSDPPPLGLFIDAEWTNWQGAPSNPSANDLRAAHDKWLSRSGNIATTYTSAGYANEYLKGFDWTREPLWVANYGVTSPLLPIGTLWWDYWQFASTLDGKQLDPNGNAELDGNYANKTITPPPNGEPMTHYGKMIYAAGLNIRNGPGTTYTDIGDLYLNDLVEASEINALGWWHLTKATHNGVPVMTTSGQTVEQRVDVWASGGNGTYIVEYAPEPPPPAIDYPESVTLNYAGGIKKDYIPK